MSRDYGSKPYLLCPRCKKRECEVSCLDGIAERYCYACNDQLAESYREAQEFQHFHSED